MATAVGDIKSTNNTKRAACLMTAQTANTGAPSASTDGIPNYPTNVISTDDGACFTGHDARESTLMVRSTAGSGTMVGTFTLWGYLAAANDWFPMSVNGGTQLSETSADKIVYAQRYQNLGHFDRLFLQLASVGGTATAFEAWVVTGLSGLD